MQQIGVQTRCLSAYDEFVVRVQSLPTGLATFHQTQSPFRIPRVPNPLAEIEIQAIDKKPLLARFTAGKSLPNRTCQLGRNCFVRVEAQHPWLRAALQGKVLLRDMTLPGMNFKASAKLLRHLPRAIF